MAGTTALRLGIGAVVLALVLLLGFIARRQTERATGTEATLWQHVEELRRRLLWSLSAYGVAVLLLFSFRLGPDPWWLLRPAVHDTLAAQVFSLLAAHVVPEGVQLVVQRPFDGLAAEVSISLGVGAILASPVLLAHLIGFVSPALRPHEKRALRSAFVPILLLFLAGAAFAVWWIVPALLEALYGYADALGATPLLAVSDVVSFTMTMAILFGVAFQTPLAMTVLSRAGLVRPRSWARWWRIATIAIVVVCAFVVDGTVLTLLLVAAPLLGLYGLGILGAFAFRPRVRTGTS